MSLTRLFVSAATAVAVAGCAGLKMEQGLPTQAVGVTAEVTNDVARLNPCTRANIKPRPAREVSEEEKNQWRSAGSNFYQHAGYYLVSEKSALEKWVPTALAVGGAVIGYSIGGSGTAGRTIGTIGGGIAGGMAGEWAKNNAKLERMARETGCEAYVEKDGLSNVPEQRGRRQIQQPWSPYQNRRYYSPFGAADSLDVPETDSKLAYEPALNVLALK